MRGRSLAIDVGVALAVLGLSLGLVAARGLGTPEPANRDLDVLAVLLVAAASLPLVARRVAPLAVYLTTSVASLTLITLDYAIDIPLGPLVALHQVGATFGGDPRPARRWAAVASAAAFVPAVAAASDELLGLGPELLVMALMILGVWIAGDRTRLRHERIVELEERAHRSDRDAHRERRLAAAEERTRIARELHDSAGHAINVILVQASAARLLHERDPARSLQAIGVVEDVARATIVEIDQLVHALREDDPAEPPPANPAAYEELVEHHRAGGLRVATDVRGSRGALPRSVAWATYRILQEALTNAARHGRGSADVAMRFHADSVHITVASPIAANGSIPVGGGHGIVGMRERATLLGGTLEAGTDNGTFRLHARLPYTKAAA